MMIVRRWRWIIIIVFIIIVVTFIIGSLRGHCG